MAKSVIKELIIVLLLCLAIILVLGILFYEYIPLAKEVPEDVKYSTSDTTEEQKTEIRGLTADEEYYSGETESSQQKTTMASKLTSYILSKMGNSKKANIDSIDVYV